MDQIEDADVEMPELVELVDDEGGLQEIIDIVRVHRWKATYERIIATAADVNSLILSNHVQLLTSSTRTSTVLAISHAVTLRLGGR
uniref:Uncharacterized protein n=1 Tax=Oryza glumipatula TaxID=40148 RepID=A0A0D9ZVG5_9ORYZ